MSADFSHDGTQVVQGLAHYYVERLQNGRALVHNRPGQCTSTVDPATGSYTNVPVPKAVVAEIMRRWGGTR